MFFFFPLHQLIKKVAVRIERKSAYVIRQCSHISDIEGGAVPARSSCILCLCKFFSPFFFHSVKNSKTLKAHCLFPCQELPKKRDPHVKSENDGEW